jgi:hypothetical protein
MNVRFGYVKANLHKPSEVPKQPTIKKFKKLKKDTSSEGKNGRQ